MPQYLLITDALVPADNRCPYTQSTERQKNIIYRENRIQNTLRKEGNVQKFKISTESTA